MTTKTKTLGGKSQPEHPHWFGLVWFGFRGNKFVATASLNYSRARQVEGMHAFMVFYHIVTYSSTYNKVKTIEACCLDYLLAVY